MSTEPGDDASVKIEKAGHYCIAFSGGLDHGGDDGELLPIVYDGDRVFGTSTTLQDPNGVILNGISGIVEGRQYGDAKTSSAFAALRGVSLGPGESVTVTSFYGRAEDVSELPAIAARVRRAGYASGKLERARTLMDELTSSVETRTASGLFDGAIKQNYLDNSLRGGVPLILGELDDRARASNADEDDRLKVYHVYSRIHGDLERDYNDFSIQPTYFSQGPGNYRDVAQNRRNDVVFSPRIGSFVVRQFLSFIQADGYEPLTVEAMGFMIHDADQASRVAAMITADDDSAKFIEGILMSGVFRPGQLFAFFEKMDVNLTLSSRRVIDEIMAISTETPMAVYGSGYW